MLVIWLPLCGGGQAVGLQIYKCRKISESRKVISPLVTPVWLRHCGGGQAVGWRSATKKKTCKFLNTSKILQVLENFRVQKSYFPFVYPCMASPLWGGQAVGWCSATKKKLVKFSKCLKIYKCWKISESRKVISPLVTPVWLRLWMGRLRAVGPPPPSKIRGLTI